MPLENSPVMESPLFDQVRYLMELLRAALLLNTDYLRQQAQFPQTCHQQLPQPRSDRTRSNPMFEVPELKLQLGVASV